MCINYWDHGLSFSARVHRKGFLSALKGGLPPAGQRSVKAAGAKTLPYWPEREAGRTWTR